MRILFTNTVTCAKHADAIARALRDAGLRVTRTRARDGLARMLGYRSWNELTAFCGVVGIPSPFDEDCTDAEVANRRRFQAKILHMHFGIATNLAKAIVNTVRPTAFGATAADPAIAAKDEYLALLERIRISDGFVTPGLAYTAPLKGKPTFVAERLGATVKVWVRRAEMYERVRDAMPHRFLVLAYVDGEVVGVLRGYGVSSCIKGGIASTGPSPSENLFSEAVGKHFLTESADLMVDAFGPDVGALAHDALRNRGTSTGSIKSPTPTDGMILPVTWETAAGRAARGLGNELWKALFKAYDAKRWGYGTVLFNPAPPQFAHVTPLVRHAKLAYQMASAKIYDHLSGLVDDEEVLRPPLFQTFLDPQDAGDGERTRTARSEPRPLRKGQWPAGYDIDWLFGSQALVKVAPSPLLWRNMPSDLAKITVVYNEMCVAGQDGLAPYPETWEFHFSNGTTLTLCDAALGDFGVTKRVFPFLCDRYGDPLAQNPYTSRMTIPDMLAVLATNVSLVFGGNPDREGRDTGRITLSRA